MTYAYVGCRTTEERNARGKGLKTYKIEQDGQWQEIQCLATEENPSYQTLDNEKKFLYSVHGDITKVSSYKILADGTLEYINMLDIGGKNPVYITVDKMNKYLIVATLQGGFVCSLERNTDGSIGKMVSKIKYEGKKAENHSFVHQCIWDQNKEFILAPAQGRIIGKGQVRVLRFNSEDGSLTETERFYAREYAEPRHISVHPNNKWVYLINEKENNMTFFEFNSQKGKLTPRQILPTLPDTYTGDGQASASLIDPSGQILIGSNRIHESLVLYRINQHTGYLKILGFASVLGKTPRFMTFNEDGSKLYVANEDSDTIVELKLDADKGILEYTGRIIATESPVCISFK